MTASHGLSPAILNQIVHVLAQFSAVEHTVLFGSRAKGTQQRGSDIDLALSGSLLDWRIVGKIDEALDDLMLPYRFSLIIYDETTDAEVAAHIARVGISLYPRQLETAQ